MQDFPGGSVVKNPPANAGDIGLTPGPGTRIPHAVGQLLSLYTLEPTPYNKRSHCDKPVQCNTVMKTAYSPPAKKKKTNKKLRMQLCRTQEIPSKVRYAY